MWSQIAASWILPVSSACAGTDILAEASPTTPTEPTGAVLSAIVLAIPVATVLATVLVVYIAQRLEIALRVRQAEMSIREADAVMAASRARLAAAIVDEVISQESCSTSPEAQIAVIGQASPGITQRPALIGNVTLGFSGK